jgi:hypothetical protein
MEIGSGKDVAVVWGRKIDGKELGIAVVGIGISDETVGIVVGAGEWEGRSMRPVGKEIEFEVGVCVFVGLRCVEVRSVTDVGTKTVVIRH